MPNFLVQLWSKVLFAVAWLAMAAMAGCSGRSQEPSPMPADLATSPDVAAIDDADAGVIAITDTDLGVAVDTATDVDADPGTDGNVVSDTAAPVDAIADGTEAVDVANNDALDAAATEPTEPAVAPLDCPNLPAMCGTGRSAPWVVDNEYFVPGQPSALSSAWSRWIPRKLAAVGQHTVRVWASWHNQRYLEYVVDKSGNVTKLSEIVTGCHGTKASLLPSGCVIFDVSTQTGVVTKVEFEPMAPGDWEPLQASPPFPELKIPANAWCSGVGTYGAEEMMSATAADGTTVTAWPGRASMHLLPADHLADPSPLVRDLPNGSTATVLELQKGAESLPTQVKADVSVCHATVAQIQSSGCACPEVTDLPVDVMPSDNYIRLTWPGGGRVYSRSWFDSLGVEKWTRAGLPKFDGENKLASTCTFVPSLQAEDWQCGGNAKMEVPWSVWPTVGLLDFDTAPVYVSLYTNHPFWFTESAGLYPMTPLAFVDDQKYTIAAHMDDGTLAAKAPARNRDGVATRISVSIYKPAYAAFPGANPELEIYNISAFFSRFEYRNVIVSWGQRHFKGGQVPQGLKLGKLDGFLSTWEPK